MLARASSASPWGVEAIPIQIEVDLHSGLPQMQIVGLPDTAVRKSRKRVRSAVRSATTPTVWWQSPRASLELVDREWRLWRRRHRCSHQQRDRALPDVVSLDLRRRQPAQPTLPLYLARTQPEPGLQPTRKPFSEW